MLVFPETETETEKEKTLEVKLPGFLENKRGYVYIDYPESTKSQDPTWDTWAAALAMLIKKMGVKKIDFVGDSMGTPIAVKTANLLSHLDLEVTLRVERVCYMGLLRYKAWKLLEVTQSEDWFNEDKVKKLNTRFMLTLTKEQYYSLYQGALKSNLVEDEAQRFQGRIILPEEPFLDEALHTEEAYTYFVDLFRNNI